VYEQEEKVEENIEVGVGEQEVGEIKKGKVDEYDEGKQESVMKI